MKKISLILCIIVLLSALSACRDADCDLWQSAKYTEEMHFGAGAKTIEVEVTAQGRSVIFVIKTDKDMLGDALLEHGLISGDAGPYGLYVKVVNGMEADYDVNGTYWAFTKDGASLLSGVDNEIIENGAHYEISCVE